MLGVRHEADMYGVLTSACGCPSTAKLVVVVICDPVRCAHLGQSRKGSGKGKLLFVVGEHGGFFRHRLIESVLHNKIVVLECFYLSCVLLSFVEQVVISLQVFGLDE